MFSALTAHQALRPLGGLPLELAPVLGRFRARAQHVLEVLLDGLLVRRRRLPAVFVRVLDEQRAVAAVAAQFRAGHPLVRPAEDAPSEAMAAFELQRKAGLWR